MEKLLNSEEYMALLQFLSNNSLLQAADVAQRISWLTNCGLEEYSSHLPLQAPSYVFFDRLCTILLDDNFTSDDPSKLALVAFLEHIHNLPPFQEEGKEYIEDLIDVLNERQSLKEQISDAQPKTSDFTLDRAAVRTHFGPVVRLVKIAEFAPISDEGLRQYYEGAPLTWNVITTQGDVKRDLYDELVNSLSMPGNRTKMLCLTGEPGSGKSTLAWRVAAEVAQATNCPLLQVLDNEEDAIWYRLEAFVEEYEVTLVLLVDDVFRSIDTIRALTSLRIDLKVTIITTSRSNEIPDDLRLPFQVKIVELKAPTLNEKILVLQRLGLNERTLEKAQRKRLQSANSWLVLMLETTTGEELTKIINDTLKRLKQQDKVMYRAYEYLCYAGQYDLAIPESLIATLYASKLIMRPECVAE